jgi:hypothetical protein
MFFVSPSRPFGYVSEWRRPRDEVLRGEVFERDHPGFSPFPTVALMVKTAFCPLLAVHEMFHGLSSPLADPETETRVYHAGELFHQLAAEIKVEVGSGRLPPSVDAIMPEALKSTARRARQRAEIKDVEYYIRPWIASRLREGNLAASAGTLFEVRVMGWVKFSTGSESLTVPLVGRIDELDFEKNRVVERTTRGERNSPNPPLLKDYQVWLLWKILTSLRSEDIPEPWRKNYKNAELVVETPHNYYTVPKDNPEFERQSLAVLSWIRDLAEPYRGSLAVADAHKVSFPLCRTHRKDRECGVNYCVRKRRNYPRSRPRFWEDYRALFQEVMWRRDLTLYRLLCLSPMELVQLGVLCQGRIKGWERGRVSLEMDATNLQVFRRIDLNEMECRLLVGTPRFGVEVPASVEEQSGNTCRIAYSAAKLPETDQAFLLFQEVLVFKSAPFFLNKLRQKHLYSLEKWGKDKREEAEKEPTIQLLEATSSGVPGLLRLGGEDEREETV